MKKNAITELHGKTVEELRKLILDHSNELAKARLEKRAGISRKNLREMQDNLARVLTVLSAKQSEVA